MTPGRGSGSSGDERTRAAAVAFVDALSEFIREVRPLLPEGVSPEEFGAAVEEECSRRGYDGVPVGSLVGWVH